ncbi:MAG TPA: 50S ribosomal protein L25/general stress protein Ctc [Anaeromyxobacteraceae bacterium]|nr:50S ribosomal protein L25/general stress protein Ctc [Anaeromyxobacteraceae bacterium]
MAESILTAEKREGKGKGPARRLRQKGLIPAVVYGRKGEPTHLAVDPAGLLKAIDNPQKFNTLLKLQADGKERYVLFKDYQVDPVTRKLLHADFLEVTLDQAVKVEVPVVTTGRAQGQTEGGILSISAHEIVVEALPNKIPLQIEVDVTNLKIGGSIHISELKAPEGCKFKFATDYVVAFVAVPEKEEVVAVAAVVPGAEGAVPGAPGAAPGAPGAAPGAPGAAAPAAGAAPGAAAAPAAPAKAAPPAKGEKGKK